MFNNNNNSPKLLSAKSIQSHMFLRNSSQVADSIVAASPNSLQRKMENIYSLGNWIMQLGIFFIFNGFCYELGTKYNECQLLLEAHSQGD